MRVLRAAAEECRGCPLYKNATQTVFGRGRRSARVVIVGEQPGDVEDRQGEPFVGPAGKELDRALAEAGLDRDDAYLTNAVKHFKFAAVRGKRRIHQPPNRGEIVACQPWLVAELRLIRPAVVVALGATAAKSLLGPAFRVSEQRGIALPWPASAQYPELFPAHEGVVVTTVHPSAVLRAEDREATHAGFVADLRLAAKVLSNTPAKRTRSST